MTTIIANVLIILAIILVGAFFVFVLITLAFPKDNEKKVEDEEKKDYAKEIKNIEDRQSAIYRQLLAIQNSAKEEEKVEPAPVEETKTITIVTKEVEQPKEEEVKEEPVVEEIVSEPVVEEPIVEEIVEQPKKKMPTRRRSFALKLSSSSDATKRYFSDITNALRAYGLTARVGKSKVLFRANKQVYARMIFKGKRIILCLPLDPKSKKFDPAVYKQLDYSKKKGFENIAFGIKITNKKVVEQIMELIDIAMKKCNFVKNPKVKVIDYVEKYPDTYNDFEKKGYGYLIRPEVSKAEVEIYDDSFAEKIVVEQESEKPKPKRIVKDEIMLSQFCNRYTDTDIPVDIDRLKASELVGKTANYLVVKASERIDKPFVVIANEFEPDAVKMICMAGGTAVKITFKDEQN